MEVISLHQVLICNTQSISMKCSLAKQASVGHWAPRCGYNSDRLSNVIDKTNMAVCENTIQQMYIRTLLLSPESGCMQWMHALFNQPNHTPAQVKAASFLHIVPTIKDQQVWFVNSSHVHLQCFEVPNRQNHVKHSYVSKNPQHPAWLRCAPQWMVAQCDHHTKSSTLWQSWQYYMYTVSCV